MTTLADGQTILPEPPELYSVQLSACSKMTYVASNLIPERQALPHTTDVTIQLHTSPPPAPHKTMAGESPLTVLSLTSHEARVLVATENSYPIPQNHFTIGPTNHKPQHTKHKINKHGCDSPLRLHSSGPRCCRRCRPPRLPLPSV